MTDDYVLSLGPALALLCAVLIALGAYWAQQLHGGPFEDREMTSRGATQFIPMSARQFFAWLSAPLVRALVHARVSADAITLFSIVLAVAAAIAVAFDRFALGGWIYLATGLCDFFDGRVARASGSAGLRGAVLDSVVDRYAERALAPRAPRSLPPASIPVLARGQSTEPATSFAKSSPVSRPRTSGPSVTRRARNPAAAACAAARWAGKSGGTHAIAGLIHSSTGAPAAASFAPIASRCANTPMGQPFSTTTSARWWLATSRSTASDTGSALRTATTLSDASSRTGVVTRASTTACIISRVVSTPSARRARVT